MKKDKLSFDEGAIMRSLLDMPGGLELHIGVGSEPKMGGKGTGDVFIRFLNPGCRPSKGRNNALIFDGLFPNLMQVLLIDSQQFQMSLLCFQLLPMLLRPGPADASFFDYIPSHLPVADVADRIPACCSCSWSFPSCCRCC